MIIEFVTKRLRIYFNGANTIQRIVFFNEEGQQLLVMFEKWGVYDPQRPAPIELLLNCGGLVVGEDEFGETEFGTCFLSRQQGELVFTDLEAPVVSFTLLNRAFKVHMRDEDGLVGIEFPQVSKMKGPMEVGGNIFYFHEWKFDVEIRFILDDGKGV